MRKGERKARFSLWVSPALMDWYREQAWKSGVSISNMVAIGLQFYREQRDAISVLKDVLEVLQRDGVGSEGVKQGGCAQGGGHGNAAPVPPCRLI